MSNKDDLIKLLPYFFKARKDNTSNNSKLFDILASKFDFMESVTNYAYNQLYMNTIDDTTPSWIYKTVIPININVNNITSVHSTSITLTKVNSLTDFLNIYQIDNYYNENTISDLYYIDTNTNILYTRKSYDNNIFITINGIDYSYPLYVHHLWNYFDDVGYMLSCPRLYLENNSDYKLRILDVFKNPANSTKLGLINGIARELGIRKFITIPNGGVDYLITDSMINIDSIRLDDKIIDSSKFTINDNQVTIKGNTNYNNISRTLSYIYGLEIHVLADKNDNSLLNELYNTDGSGTIKLQYYKNYIASLVPFEWNEFSYDNAFWDTNKETIGSAGVIPNMNDASIDGFANYNV